MECGQFRPGIGPEAVGEGAAGVLVGGQRVGPAVFGPQGADQLGPEALVVRMGRGQFLQFRYEGARAGAGAGTSPRGRALVRTRTRVRTRGRAFLGGPQVRLDAAFQRGQAVGLRAQAVPVVPARQIGQGGAAPQGERGAERAGGRHGVARVEFPGPLPGQPLEHVQIDLAGPGLKAVTALGARDRVPAQRTAQPAHERLERGGRVVRRLVGPDVVDQIGDGDGAPTGRAPPFSSRASVTPRIRYRTRPLCPAARPSAVDPAGHRPSPVTDHHRPARRVPGLTGRCA